MYDERFRYTDGISDRDSSTLCQVVHGDNHARLLLIDEAKGTATGESIITQQMKINYTDVIRPLYATYLQRDAIWVLYPADHLSEHDFLPIRSEG